MENNNLAKILAPYTKDNLWVVLNSDRTKVVGKGTTLKGALEDAKKADSKNTVAMKAIPDSSGFIL